MNEWHLFHGKPQEPHDETQRLVELTPPWRKSQGSGARRGQTYIASVDDVRLVNAALYLKRPVLVTGPPGCGKSSLAYAIAEELKLGDVLKWPINSRSALTDGLYHYDAIARLRDANLQNPLGQTGGGRKVDDISRYLQLQWLGTAIASPTPRVVLIDEIDKADIDLPNDLLHVLEEGSFVIPELLRLADEHEAVSVPTCEPDRAERVTVRRGVVSCRSFPVIVLTSNGERELPLAFHRRCLRLDIQPPGAERLTEIVESHLKDVLSIDAAARERIDGLIREYLNIRNQGRVMATDQLLNLVYLLFHGGIGPKSTEAGEIQRLLFRGLDE